MGTDNIHSQQTIASVKVVSIDNEPISRIVTAIKSINDNIDDNANQSGKNYKNTIRTLDDIVRNNRKAAEDQKLRSIRAERNDRAANLALSNNISKTLSAIDILKNTISDCFDKMANIVKDSMKQSLRSFSDLSKVMRQEKLTAAQKQSVSDAARSSIAGAKETYGINVSNRTSNEAMTALIQKGLVSNIEQMSKEARDGYVALVASGVDAQEAYAKATTLSVDQMKKEVLSRSDSMVKGVIADLNSRVTDVERLNKLGGADAASQQIIDTASGFAKTVGGFMSNETIANMGKTFLDLKTGNIAGMDEKALQDALVAFGTDINKVKNMTAEQMGEAISKKLQAAAGNKDELEKLSKHLYVLQKGQVGSDKITNELAQGVMMAQNNGSLGRKIRTEEENKEALADNTENGKIPQAIDSLVSKLDTFTGGKLSALSNSIDEYFGDSLTIDDVVSNGLPLICKLLSSISLSGIISKPLSLLTGLIGNLNIFGKIKGLFKRKDGDGDKNKQLDLDKEYDEAIKILKELKKSFDDKIKPLKELPGKLKESFVEKISALKELSGKMKVSFDEKIKPLKELPGKMKESFRVGIEEFKNAPNKMKFIAEKVGSGVKAGAEKVWSGIKVASGKVWSGIKVASGKVWSGMKAASSNVWKRATSAFSDIKKRGVIALSKIPGMFKGIGGKVGGAGKKMLAGAGIFTGAMGLLSATGAFDSLTPIFENFMNTIAPMVKDLVTTLAPSIDAILKMLAPVLGDIIKSLTPLLDSLFKAVTPILESIFKVLTPLLKTLFDVLNPILQVVIDTLMPVLNTIVEVLSPILELIGEFLKPLAPILQDIMAPIGEVLKQVISPLGRISKWLKEEKGVVDEEEQDKKIAEQKERDEMAKRRRDELGKYSEEELKKIAETLSTKDSSYSQIADILKNNQNITKDQLINVIRMHSSGGGADGGKKVMSDEEFNNMLMHSLDKKASGGIISSATPALVGEAGKEAILPLERPEDMKRVLSSLDANEKLSLLKILLGKRTSVTWDTMSDALLMALGFSGGTEQLKANALTSNIIAGAAAQKGHSYAEMVCNQMVEAALKYAGFTPPTTGVVTKHFNHPKMHIVLNDPVKGIDPNDPALIPGMIMFSHPFTHAEADQLNRQKGGHRKAGDPGHMGIYAGDGLWWNSTSMVNTTDYSSGKGVKVGGSRGVGVALTKPITKGTYRLYAAGYYEGMFDGSAASTLPSASKDISPQEASQISNSKSAIKRSGLLTNEEIEQLASEAGINNKYTMAEFTKQASNLLSSNVTDKESIIAILTDIARFLKGAIPKQPMMSVNRPVASVYH